jgi:F0F1-type ATP synthase assembly protein I
MAIVLIAIAAVVLGPNEVSYYDEKTKKEVTEKVNKPMSVLSALVSGAIWSLIIYFLCKYCHNKWAWFILLLPIIIIIGALIVLGAAGLLIWLKQASAFHGLTPAHENISDEEVARSKCDLFARNHCPAKDYQCYNHYVQRCMGGVLNMGSTPPIDLPPSYA